MQVIEESPQSGQLLGTQPIAKAVRKKSFVMSGLTALGFREGPRDSAQVGKALPQAPGKQVRHLQAHRPIASDPQQRDERQPRSLPPLSHGACERTQAVLTEKIRWQIVANHGRDMRDDPQIQAALAGDTVIVRAGQKRQVGLATRQALGTTLGRVESQLEKILVQSLLKPVGERTRTQERNRGQAHALAHDTAPVTCGSARRNGLDETRSLPSASTLYRVSRSTGTRPACLIKCTMSGTPRCCGVSAPAM